MTADQHQHLEGIDVEIPNELKELLQYKNGQKGEENGVFDLLKFMSSIDIIHKWERQEYFCSNTDFHNSIPVKNDSKIRKEYWNKGWIPFTEDTENLGYLHCIDTNPTLLGNIGQIILVGTYSHKYHYRKVVSANLKQFIDSYTGFLNHNSFCIEAYNLIFNDSYISFQKNELSKLIEKDAHKLEILEYINTVSNLYLETSDNDGLIFEFISNTIDFTLKYELNTDEQTSLLNQFELILKNKSIEEFPLSYQNGFARLLSNLLIDLAEEKKFRKAFYVSKHFISLADNADLVSPKTALIECYYQRYKMATGNKKIQLAIHFIDTFKKYELSSFYNLKRYAEKVGVISNELVGYYSKNDTNKALIHIEYFDSVFAKTNLEEYHKKDFILYYYGANLVEMAKHSFLLEKNNYTNLKRAFVKIKYLYNLYPCEYLIHHKKNIEELIYKSECAQKSSFTFFFNFYNKANKKTVIKAWGNFEDYLKNVNPDGYEDLEKGASNREIANLEKELMSKLPAYFRAFLQVHNGQIKQIALYDNSYELIEGSSSYYFLNTKEIHRQWEFNIVKNRIKDAVNLLSCIGDTYYQNLGTVQVHLKEKYPEKYNIINIFKDIKKELPAPPYCVPISTVSSAITNQLEDIIIKLLEDLNSAYGAKSNRQEIMLKSIEAINIIGKKHKELSFDESEILHEKLYDIAGYYHLLDYDFDLFEFEEWGTI